MWKKKWKRKIFKRKIINLESCGLQTKKKVFKNKKLKLQMKNKNKKTQKAHLQIAKKICSKVSIWNSSKTWKSFDKLFIYFSWLLNVGYWYNFENNID